MDSIRIEIGVIMISTRYACAIKRSASDAVYGTFVSMTLAYDTARTLCHLALSDAFLLLTLLYIYYVPKNIAFSIKNAIFFET